MNDRCKFERNYETPEFVMGFNFSIRTNSKPNLSYSTRCKTQSV